MIETQHAILDVRVTNLEKVVEKVSSALISIDESLKTLTRLDVKHDETRTGLVRAFSSIEDHEDRVRKIEEEIPTLKLVRGWVIAGTLALVGLVGVSIVNLIFK